MKFLVILVLAAMAAAQVAVADEGAWLTDFSKAQAEAKQSRKLVLLDFNGSDWCPPCQALKREVLATPEFREYARRNLVLVDVDFPHLKELPKGQLQNNEALAEKFGVEGFPTIVVLDSNGKELEKKSGYEGETAKEFIAKLEKLRKQQAA